MSANLLTILFLSMASKQQKQQDLGQRLEQLKVLQTQLSQKIEDLSSAGELAPTQAWIVRYLARGKGGSYWYYKWQSPEPIFITQKGQKSRYKYIGKAGSPAFLKAVEMVARRSQIEGLQQSLHTLELGLLDLVEEATRMEAKSKRK